MNRKAKISLFTDIIFFGLTVLAVIIFALAVFSVKDRIEDKARSDNIDWEADYLAYSLMQLVMPDGTLLYQKLSNPNFVELTDDEKKYIDKIVDNILVPKILGGELKGEDSAHFLIIVNDKMIYCRGRTTSLADTDPCADSAYGLLSNTPGKIQDLLDQKGLVLTLKNLVEYYKKGVGRAGFHYLRSESEFASVVIIQ